MIQNLMILFLLIIAAVFAAVRADDSYYPCKSYISFSYDDSNALNNDDFKTQMNFIRSVVSTLNYPNRLRAEGGYTGEFNWNSGLNIGQMEINLHNAQQNPMPYSLSQQAASLLTSIEVLENNQNIPVAPILFISDTSDFALKNADRWFAKLSGISITFILLGTNVDQSKLENCLGDISWTFIYWTDLTLFAPDGWDYNSFNAFGCVHPPTPTGSITPYTIPSPTPTESPDCQSWISFSVDSTYTIVFNDFYTELTFLSKIIGVDFHYPQKIQVTTNSGEYVRWYNHDSMVEIKGTVLTLPQYSHLRYNLSSQFEYLASELENIDSLPNVATIIFISDTSDSALLGAEGFLPYLTNVRITFILLGPNADSSKLTKFSSNFIFWKDLSKPQPDNWNNLKYHAYGCYGEKN